MATEECNMSLGCFPFATSDATQNGYGAKTHIMRGTSECGSGEETDSAAGRVRNPSHEFRRGSNYHYCVRITEMFKWASIP